MHGAIWHVARLRPDACLAAAAVVAVRAHGHEEGRDAALKEFEGILENRLQNEINDYDNLVNNIEKLDKKIPIYGNRHCLAERLDSFTCYEKAENDDDILKCRETVEKYLKCAKTAQRVANIISSED